MKHPCDERKSIIQLRPVYSVVEAWAVSYTREEQLVFLFTSVVTRVLKQKFSTTLI